MKHLDNYGSPAFEQQSCDFGTEKPVPFDSSLLSESTSWTHIVTEKHHALYSDQEYAISAGHS